LPTLAKIFWLLNGRPSPRLTIFALFVAGLAGPLATFFGWQSVIALALLAGLVYAAARFWKYTRTPK
jgi:hypothetical protein